MRLSAPVGIGTFCGNAPVRFNFLDNLGSNLKNSDMKLTEKQKGQGKWQRSFTREKVSRSTWLKNNDKRLLNAILDRRHMKHKPACKADCGPGWAKIPKKDLKKMTNLGQDKLNEAIERLVERKVVKRESEGPHAGRDGATRYRIVSLPAYDPAPASHAEIPQIDSTSSASLGPTSDKGNPHEGQ